ncbi:hypothetical protein SUGI_0353600 [Cryptomeria japonica]|nr:hypothetical protein SUGI_0353600 [Cryptomeria japonica]
MPNLETLGLGSDLRCRELPKNFSERGGFPKLSRMAIFEFPLLEELPALEKGAMQRLEAIGLYNCPRIKKVPEGIVVVRGLVISLFWERYRHWRRDRCNVLNV